LAGPPPILPQATTNLASGIHHEAYDCDNHNEAAEYAPKLEAGLLPSNINAGLYFKPQIVGHVDVPWMLPMCYSERSRAADQGGKLSVGLLLQFNAYYP
jgi:hypothetical protein